MNNSKDYILSVNEEEKNKKLSGSFFLFSKSKILNHALIFMLLAFTSVQAFSQSDDSKKSTTIFGGTITVTNKGMSTIPNLSLGKPAAIFDLKIGRERLSFEPQLRFALEGKPWGFLFWWRYKLLESEKLRINVGAHPALSFKTYSLSNNGISKDYMVVRRYLGAELAPTYSVSKNVSLGLYWLYSYGVEKELVRNNNFVSLRSNFSNIKLSDQYFMRFAPQIYWLSLDKDKGFYVGSTLALVKRNFPFSISSTMNKAIESEIAQGRNFLWNICIVYSFNGKYAKL